MQLPPAIRPRNDYGATIARCDNHQGEAHAVTGVIEIRNYRNPLEVTPHVAITIDFETLDNWRDFIDSQDYIRIMRELRILGCRNFTVNVWAPSKYFPESIRPENK